jgi:hypothetical protein
MLELPNDEILAIVRALSLTWERMKSDAFWMDLALMHGIDRPLDPSKIERLIIGHALEEYFNTGGLGGFMGGWWKVSDEGLERIKRPKFMDSADPQKAWTLRP